MVYRGLALICAGGDLFEEIRSSYTKDDGQPDLVDKCERLLHESVLVALAGITPSPSRPLH
jgi:hypothetical protein